MAECVLGVREPVCTAFPGTTPLQRKRTQQVFSPSLTRKQGMAQVVTAASIMPCLWLNWQLLKPRPASLTNFTFMVQVQAPGGGTCIGRTQIDPEGMRTWTTIQLP